MSPPPTLDGIIDPEEWKDVPPMEGGFDEDNGNAAPERTIWWIGYDQTYIYFAARAYDRDPKSIKANEYRTNVSLDGDDTVGFWIDPFNTLRGDNLFEINARGATNPEIAGGRAAKREWLGEILAKARITPEGYEVEARVPWNVLRLPGKGIRDMRIAGFRKIARTDRMYLSHDISGNNNDKLPYWRGVNTPEIKEDRSVKLLPYTYFGYDEDHGYLANAGLDFKTRLYNLDVVGSVNPDFRNIENQILSLDFSYFERLADESRPFFLEGAEFFRTSGDAPLFVSQRIPSTFDFALKTFGKLSDKLTIAALNATDATRQNDTVVVGDYAIDLKSNVRFGIANRSTAGLNNFGTFASYFRNMGGLDPFLQVQTTSDTEMGMGHRINGGLSINKGKMNGFAEYVEISPEFLPRLGFAPEKDFRGFAGGLFYGDTLSKGMIMDYEVGAFGQHYDKYSGGGLYRQFGEVFASTSLRNRYGFNVGLARERFGEHDDQTFNASIRYPVNDPYRGWAVGVTNGHRAGHTYESFFASARYRLTRPLQLNASYQQVTHFTRDSLTQFSANYDINAYDSIGGRAIMRGSDLNFYVAYRRTGNTGNEYFLIFGDPNAQRFRPSIVLKAVFPIEWKF